MSVYENMKAKYIEIEYANSKYSTKALRTIGKAKANASQVIPKLIKIATNISFQGNTEPKHAKCTKYGWYRCTIRFTLPISDDKGNVIGKNYFQGRMTIQTCLCREEILI